jgi:hypothetical protein
VGPTPEMEEKAAEKLDAAFERIHSQRFVDET